MSGAAGGGLGGLWGPGTRLLR